MGQTGERETLDGTVREVTSYHHLKVIYIPGNHPDAPSSIIITRVGLPPLLQVCRPPVVVSSRLLFFKYNSALERFERFECQLQFQATGFRRFSMVEQ